MPKWCLVGAGLVGALACTPELCPQLGCVAAPWISIVDDAAVGGRLRAGIYGFVLTTEDMAVEWACDLRGGASADAACAQKLGAAGEFEGQPIVWQVEVANGANGLEIALLEIRDDGSVFGGPAEFSLAVTRDGALQAMQEFSPTYSGRWINGEGCDPYCASPEQAVVLHLPP